jgi:mutator protein MutT
MVSLLLLIKKNKYLMVKRSFEEENYAGYWGVPGGKIEKGETPKEGLKREINEEIGLSINDLTFLGEYEFNSKIFVFFREDPKFDETSISLNEEHTDYKFFSYSEIQNNKNIIPSMKNFVIDYLSQKLS